MYTLLFVHFNGYLLEISLFYNLELRLIKTSHMPCEGDLKVYASLDYEQSLFPSLVHRARNQKKKHERAPASPPVSRGHYPFANVFFNFSLDGPNWKRETARSLEILTDVLTLLTIF